MPWHQGETLYTLYS